MTDLLIRNAKHGRGLAQRSARTIVALMRGHGNVCVGANVMAGGLSGDLYRGQCASFRRRRWRSAARSSFSRRRNATLITGRKDTNFQRPWAMWKSRIAAA